MLFKLLVAFIVIPLIELVLLIKLAEVTSIAATIALVIVTGVIGSYLARREGMLTLRRFQSALAQGRVPSREIQDGLMIVFAAALLLTPGLLTDALGFVLLIPAGRALVRRTLLKGYIGRFRVHVSTHGFDPGAGRDGRDDPSRGAIDVKAVDRKPHA